MEKLMRMLGMTSREKRYLSEVPESRAVQRLRQALAFASVRLDNLSRWSLNDAVQDLREEILDSDHCV